MPGALRAVPATTGEWIDLATGNLLTRQQIAAGTTWLVSPFTVDLALRIANAGLR